MPDWTSRTLAANLKHYRAEIRLSQKEVAVQAQVSYRLVQELEAAAGNPTLATLQRIAKLFKVTINTLLELRFLRLAANDEHFLDRYKEAFTHAGVAAALRNLEGVTIWANAPHARFHGDRQWAKKGPADITQFFSGESLGVFRHQLATEKTGYVAPYTLALDQSPDVRLHLRCYPTLILPQRGRAAAFASVYLTEMSQDCTLNYYEYCKHLLTAAYPD